MLDPITAISFSMFENKGVYAVRPALGSGLSSAAHKAGSQTERAAEEGRLEKLVIGVLHLPFQREMIPLVLLLKILTGMDVKTLQLQTGMIMLFHFCMLILTIHRLLLQSIIPSKMQTIVVLQRMR